MYEWVRGRGHSGRLTMYRRRIAPHCRMRELPDYLEAPDAISYNDFFVPYPNSMWEHKHLGFYLYNCLSFERTRDFFFFFYTLHGRDIAHFYSRCLSTTKFRSVTHGGRPFYLSWGDRRRNTNVYSRMPNRRHKIQKYPTVYGPKGGAEGWPTRGFRVVVQRRKPVSPIIIIHIQNVFLIVCRAFAVFVKTRKCVISSNDNEKKCKLL